jgi:type IV secretory pathway VirB2 component (pilin)
MFQKALIRFSQITIDPNDLEISKVTPTSSTVETVLTTVFGIMGVIAVMVIVISGMMFVLSRGNPEKSAKARRGIIYATVGLVLALSAVAIVQFAVRRVT